MIRAAALGLVLAAFAAPALAEPPHVAATAPAAGASGVSPATDHITVTFDQPMVEGWSFVRSNEGLFPDTGGQVVLQPDGKTFVMAVQLKAATQYVIWLNTSQFQNFKSQSGEPATPYRLAFTTSN